MAKKDYFKDNEVLSNKVMTVGCLITAGIILVVWILFASGVFKIRSLTMINISFPICICLLISPTCFIRTHYIYKSGFKYFLLFLYVLVVGVVNVIIPKHGILGWAIPVFLAGVFFSPKVTRITTLMVVVLMCAAMPLGMIYGEWDSNLLGIAEETFITYGYDSNSVADRLKWLNVDCGVVFPDLTNRWVSCFGFYYIGRLACLSLIYIVAINLSKRTKMMLVEEVEEATKKEKSAYELNLATALQTNVLPREFPTNKYGAISASMKPAKEVGGDFYDFFQIDHDHMGLVIGDVSGKGIPAALFMMKAETLVKAMCMTYRDNPGEVLRRTNHGLCEGNFLNMFVTCFVGVLNIYTGELKFANAGHNNPIIINNGGECKFIKGEHGMALAAFDEVPYGENSIFMLTGDRLVMYTDGVTEACDIDGKLYGENRLLDYCHNNHEKSCDDFIEGLKMSIDEFVKEAPQSDDITILVGDYLGIPYKQFPAIPNEWDNVYKYMENRLNELKVEPKLIRTILISTEEVFINIASYAYANGTGPARICIYTKDKDIVVIFRDKGSKFNPLAKQDPDITADFQDRNIGGLGIFMVKQFAKDISYDYRDGENILTVIFESK